MKFIHTADLHLVSPDKPEGAHRLEVLRELCVLARGTDALVIAGDLFDSAAEAPALESTLRRLFSEIRPAQVLIIPGNHDTLRGPDPFDGRFDFGQGGNVHIFNKKPFDVLDVRGTAFYGFPFSRSQTSFEMTRDMQPRRSETRVAIMHGLAADRPQLASFALESGNREEGGESVLRDADLRNAGFSYAALGHIHRQEVWEHGEGCVLAYAGSPDPVRITETGPRRALAVKLDRRSGLAKAHPVELKSAGRAFSSDFFLFPGDEDELAAALETFIESCGPATKAAARVSGLGDTEKTARLRARLLEKWRPKLPLGLEIALSIEAAPSETAGDMALYGFLRAMKERGADGETRNPELERRVLAAGWRALLGQRLDPEDLLENK